MHHWNTLRKDPKLHNKDEYKMFLRWLEGDWKNLLSVTSTADQSDSFTTGGTGVFCKSGTTAQFASNS